MVIERPVGKPAVLRFTARVSALAPVGGWAAALRMGAAGEDERRTGRKRHPPNLADLAVAASLERGGAVAELELADVAVGDVRASEELVDLAREAVALGVVKDVGVGRPAASS